MGEVHEEGGIGKPVKLFLAAAIFTPEDTLSFEYFRKYRSSVDDVTATDMFVGLPDVKDGVIVDLAKLFASEGKGRYPGLDRGDLPCLWVEDEHDEHRIVHLPQDQTKFAALLRGVTDAAAKASSFKEFNMAIDDLENKLNPVPPPQPQQAPPWFPKAGFASAAAAFLFLVGLILLAIFAKEVPASAKILVDAAIAIAVACAFAFFGGAAHAEGKIPFLKGHEPVRFATEGGIATFVITLLLLGSLYH